MCKKCKQNKATYLYWYNSYSDLCTDCYYDKQSDSKDDGEEVTEVEQDSTNNYAKPKNERDKWGLPEIRAQSGHRVRSRGECLIANWLYDNRILFEYERIVYLNSDTQRYLISDFYLPDAKLYIEYWGYKDKGSYNLRRDEKDTIYKEKELNLLNVEDHHINSLDDFLRKNLIKHFKHL